MPRRIPVFLVVLIAVVVLAACQSEPEAPAEPPPGPRVENADVGLAVAALPASLEVLKNDTEGLELGSVDGAGRLVFVLGELESSINLVAAARDHEASFAERPEGVFKQRTEMMSVTLGTTYLSRGQYRNEAGVMEEESVLLAIHPWGDRMLTVRYVYPVGEDAKERLQEHLFAVFGELEAMAAPAEEAAPEDG